MRYVLISCNSNKEWPVIPILILFIVYFTNAYSHIVFILRKAIFGIPKNKSYSNLTIFKSQVKSALQGRILTTPLLNTSHNVT